MTVMETMPAACPFHDRPPPKLLMGQKVLVTGASSGIGKSIAMAMGARWTSWWRTPGASGTPRSTMTVDQGNRVLFVHGGMTLYPGFEAGG